LEVWFLRWLHFASIEGLRGFVEVNKDLAGVSQARAYTHFAAQSEAFAHGKGAGR